METTYIKPPRTMMEVFESLPEGTLAQLIQNRLVMSPAPSNPHARVLDKLYRRIGDYVEEKSLGETRTAPFDVYLNAKNAFQPDIVFIANDNLHNIRHSGLHGAPDLVVEVLSPGSERYDRGAKKNVYERCGVNEYWLVDPITKTAEGFQLVDGKFKPLPTEEGQLNIRLFNHTVSF